MSFCPEARKLAPLAALCPTDASARGQPRLGGRALVWRPFRPCPRCVPQDASGPLPEGPSDASEEPSAAAPCWRLEHAFEAVPRRAPAQKGGGEGERPQKHLTRRSRLFGSTSEALPSDLDRADPQFDPRGPGECQTRARGSEGDAVESALALCAQSSGA
eukprot:6175817-Alexandrium_andersonii.AAC.1